MRMAIVAALLASVGGACTQRSKPPAAVATKTVVVMRDRWQPVVIIDNTKVKAKMRYEAGYGPTVQVVVEGGKMTLTNRMQ